MAKINNLEMRQKVCEALKRLRLIRPEFRTKTTFSEVSGVHGATIYETESGRILPGLDTIDRWVRACGLTLAEFCASLEGVTPEASAGPRIRPEHLEAVTLLIEILNGAPTEARDWLLGNLETFHRAYCQVKPKPPRRRR